MANPKGNPGNKGGGRKPMAIESRAYELLAKAFVEGINPEEIDEEIKKAMKGQGKLKLLSVYLKKAVKSEKILMDIAKKIIPDRTENTNDNTHSIKGVEVSFVGEGDVKEIEDKSDKENNN